MKNSNSARLDKCICIQDLSNITEEKFNEIVSYDSFGTRLHLRISQIKHKSVSMMLFYGIENHYVSYLEIYKLNNKVYSKYRKFNPEKNDDFIRVGKSPILHEGKIQSDEIPILKTVLKTKFDDSFIDLVCSKLDEFAKMIDVEQESIKEQPKVLKIIKQ